MALPPDVAAAWEEFIGAPAALRAAVAGADGGTLGRPGDDGWTLRDRIVAATDAELVFAVQVRLLLAEGQPVLPVADPDGWRRRLHYLWRDPEAALALFEAARWGTAEILERCDEAAWARTGLLGEREASLAELVRERAGATRLLQ